MREEKGMKRDTRLRPASGAAERDPHSLSPIGSGHGGVLRAAVRVFYQSLRQRLSEHDVSVAQWSVLRVLWDEDGLSQVELSKRLGIENAGMTAKLDAMERAGLVRRRRDPHDQRKQNIFIEKRAADIRPALTACAVEVNDIAERGIPPGDLQNMRRTMNKMIGNLLADEGDAKA